MNNPAFKDDLVSVIPNLRAFAISLVGSPDRADDLVQETLVKAWHKQSSFQPGTNFKAWMFTILRNEFYSSMRKKKREVADPDGHFSATLSTHPAQEGKLDWQDFEEALNQLPEDQREAIILVGASGFSYEEAAEVCNCAVGTIKSRVSRARTKLGELMKVEGASAFGPDGLASQVINHSLPKSAA